MHLRFYYLVVAVCGVLVWPASSSGEQLEVWWEKTPPSVEEISGGKLHVGDKITKDNVEIVKDYMPESFYLDTLSGAEWEIVPHTPENRLVIPNMVRATKENLGKAVLKEDGTVLMPDGRPWIGGFPFPEPKTALEAMVNRQFRITDAFTSNAKNYWVNSAGKTYKKHRFGITEIITTGRVCQDPKPYLPGYEDQLIRQLLVFTDPYDVKGVSVLSATYVDQSKYPDAWGYIPVLRRVQRFSSGQRYDSVDGSDLRAGDIDTFSDPLGLWDYKLVGRKFLFSILTGADKQAGNAGLVLLTEDIPLINGRYPQDARLELRDTYIIETIPKDPTHIYSKKILFIDAATWWPWLGHFYDRQDKLWTGYQLWTKRGPGSRDRISECGGNYVNIVWAAVQNYQTGSATLMQGDDMWLNPPGDVITPETFTLKHLMSLGR